MIRIVSTSRFPHRKPNANIKLEPLDYFITVGYITQTIYSDWFMVHH